MPKIKPIAAESPAGTQAIGRAVDVLKLIARRGAAGARLSEIGEWLDLSGPTAHRILARLQEERLVRRDTATRRYHLGALTFELGLSANYGQQIVRICRPTLSKLAQESGDTIYLVIRSGQDAICLDRVEGSYPIRTLTLDVGGRRVLGVGAAGQALLAAIDADEAENIIRENDAELRQYPGLTPENLRKAITETRRLGYSITEGRLTPGVNGIGMTVPNSDGTSFMAISIASISTRIADKRIPMLRGLLRKGVAALAEAMVKDGAAE